MATEAFASPGGPPNISGMCSLKVDNLSRRTTTDDLLPIFERYGRVGDIYIPRNRYTHDSRGFAFVRFYSRRDADDALERADGKMLDGRRLRVQTARYSRPADTSRRRPRGDRYDRSSRYERSDRWKYRSRSRSRDRYRSRSRSRSSDRRRHRSYSRDRYRHDSRSPSTRRGRFSRRSPSSSRSRSPSSARQSVSPRGRSSSRSPQRHSQSPGERDERPLSPQRHSQSDDSRSPSLRRESRSPEGGDSRSPSSDN